MISRNIKELRNITDGQLINCRIDINVNKIVNYDKISEKNCAYIAINGENHKGIDFAENAVKNGAVLVISDVMPKAELPTLLVADVRKALLDIAAHYRKKERKTVVAVTGSVGKTTVKELCWSVMSQKAPTLKTEGNKNNTVGLPLTLLLDEPSELAVVEAGISEIGEMSLLSRVAAPDIAIITGIGSMHAETLGARENIATEKLKLLEFASSDAVLIVPENEPLLNGFHQKTVTVGLESEDASYSAYNLNFTENGTFFDIKKRGKSYINGIFVPIIGSFGAFDALFAVAVSELLGISAEMIKAGLAAYKPAASRQNIIVKNGLTVMDDCYNFGPESARAALEAFGILAQKSAAKKTVLVLGSMLELGSESESMHLALGKEVGALNFDALITLGTLAKNIALGAMCKGMREVYDYSENEREAAKIKLTELADKGSCVLIKGSRKMRLEELAELLVK